jgi:hypothetical protein
MLKMAVGQSDDVDATAAIAEAIEQCRAQLGGAQPRIAMLFAAFDIFDMTLVDQVRREFAGIDVIGATSSAEMSSTGGYLEDSVVLSLIATDVELGVGMGDGIDIDAAAAARAAVQQATQHLTEEPSVCIVWAEGANAQRAIGALRTELPEHVLIVGGASGRHEVGGTLPTYQFMNERLSTVGLVILVLAGGVNYSTAVGTGWRVLGPLGTVTRAGYGVINEIDGRPAGEWASEYLDLQRATLGNPLAIRDAGTDDWYLRVALAEDAGGGLLIPGEVPEGATVQLTTTSPDEMLAATADAVERARASFPAGAKPEAAFIFSCAVRKYLLGSRTGQEMESAQSGLPSELPIAGMYCIGEIAPTGTDNNSHFLNETFVTLLLGT